MIGASRGFFIGMACLCATAVALAEENARVPLGDVEGWRLVPVAHVEAQVRSGEGAVMRVSFSKTGEERRLLALEAKPCGDASGARALVVRHRLNLAEGDPPRAAAVLFEKGGGVWFKVVASPVAVGELTEERLPLGSMQQAQFSRETDDEVQWDRVEKVWLGLALDGPARGTLELSGAYFTSEPYRPTRPLRITGDGPGTWGVGQDRAVKSTITTPLEGPRGSPCMKMGFSFPGGRHMYIVPRTSMPEAELEGYRALRFTYKADLPNGIDGLLVMLIEQDGSQYYADPAPAASKDWKTVTVLFEEFKLGRWSRDENEQMDLEQIGSVAIGLHGTASEEQGSGIIWVTDIEFVP